MVFVDLEEDLDRMQMEVVQWTVRRPGDYEWIVRVIIAVYWGS